MEYLFTVTFTKLTGCLAWPVKLIRITAKCIYWHNKYIKIYNIYADSASAVLKHLIHSSLGEGSF